MVGVLSFQGSFARHRAALEALSMDPRPVTRRADLEGLTHLVIPGGESTVIGQFLESEGLFEPVRSEVEGGRLALLGTCAGAILAGRATDEERAPSPKRQPRRLEVSRVLVRRNAYGRQIDSFRADVALEGALGGPGAPPFEGIFIRAPRFEGVAGDIEVLGRVDGEPVLVRDGRVLLSAFHPELTPDVRIHRFFLGL